MLVAIKAAFYWSGLYDFKSLVTRRVFWRRTLVGLALVYATSFALWCVAGEERIAYLVFLAVFGPLVILGRYAYELCTRSSGLRRRPLRPFRRGRLPTRRVTVIS